MTKHYDYIAIGGGSGGIASINRAASYGKKCAIIEANQLGGTCVNLGCVPKKVMWYGAQIAEAIHKYGPDYGFDVDVKGFDFQKLVQSRQQYIENIGKNHIATIIKLADLQDNMQVHRLKKITDKDIERLKKYHQSYIYLMEKLKQFNKL